ncbi:hypothetical protein RJ55_02397 [Drechmeria coniospora]|nr:hypothetical protein RJ55_02397 [Drechmeria coniospora]
MIPLGYTPTLDERLPVVFTEAGSYQPAPRANIPRTATEYALASRLRKAHFNYLEVLRCIPHSFLAFLLAVSPRTCSNINISQFITANENRYPAALKLEAKVTIAAAARRQGVDQSPKYLLWMDLVFQVPVIGPTAYIIGTADMTALRRIFGDYIYDAVENSPRPLLGNSSQKNIEDYHHFEKTMR